VALSSTTRKALGVISQMTLGAVLLAAGTGHLTKQREEFQAQVPEWFPADPDLVVVVSGVVELALGAALVATWKQPARALVGTAAAAFFVAVFPGNIGQYTGHVDAFGLDTDTKRAVRLVFQPVLVAWALASTDAVQVFRERRALGRT
jgi:uncharacterized membrane protein